MRRLEIMPKRLAWIAVVAAATSVTSCRKLGSELRTIKTDELSFTQLLRRGRSPSHLEGVTSRPRFDMAHPQNGRIIQLEVDSVSQAATFLAFRAGQQSDVSSDNEIDSFARAYVQSNRDLLGIDSSELVPAPSFLVQPTPSLIVANYLRQVEQQPVVGAILQLSFVRRQGGGLLLRDILNQTHGGLPIAKIPADQQVALDDIISKTGLSSDTVTSTRNVLYAAGDRPTQLTKALELTMTNPISGEQYTVIAEPSGVLLEASSDVVEINPSRVLGTAFVSSYVDQQKQQVPLAGITARTAQGIQIKADQEGIITSTGEFTSATITLQSDFARIYDGSADSSSVYSVQASHSNATILLDAPQADPAAINAYVVLQQVRNFALEHLSPSDTQWFARSLPTTVNATGSCNAFYRGANGGSVSLYGASNNCGNMALVNGVVMHEWGHGLDHHTGPSRNMADGAFSEGIGDIIAAYYYGRSDVFPGFRTNNPKGIRQLDNNATHPPQTQAEFEVHRRGLIIGGAFWHMREYFVAKMGPEAGAKKASEYFFKHLLITDTYQQSYRSILRLDDNDGDPSTPSPNFCEINAAFSRHGLAQKDSTCNVADPDDTQTPVIVPRDAELRLAVTDLAGQEAVLFHALANNAEYIDVCLGDRSTCSKTDANIARRLTRTGKKIGNKEVFSHGQPLTLTAGTSISIISRNAAGAPIGRHSVTLRARTTP